jgi:hypothetical protein
MLAPIKHCLFLFTLLLLTLQTQCQASTTSSSLRGHDASMHNIQEKVEEVNVVKQELAVDATRTLKSTSTGTEMKEIIDEININQESEFEKERRLGGEIIARLFNTPIAQWTLSQWLTLFILIWLVGYFFSCCPCIKDLLACFCCYELFCANDPMGFVLC